MENKIEMKKISETIEFKDNELSIVLEIKKNKISIKNHKNSDFGFVGDFQNIEKWERVLALIKKAINYAASENNFYEKIKNQDYIKIYEHDIPFLKTKYPNVELDEMFVDFPAYFDIKEKNLLSEGFFETYRLKHGVTKIITIEDLK